MRSAAVTLENASILWQTDQPMVGLMRTSQAFPASAVHGCAREGERAMKLSASTAIGGLLVATLCSSVLVAGQSQTPASQTPPTSATPAQPPARSTVPGLVPPHSPPAAVPCVPVTTPNTAPSTTSARLSIITSASTAASGSPSVIQPPCTPGTGPGAPTPPPSSPAISGTTVPGTSNPPAIPNR
jgi:hypothetical protein